ncbi:Ig-like domain-containing protein [Sulfurovum sp.]|uniref:Ig-like domain-containing protein n=1 Tax=Sulfurovum sp. TaxID=1969726 RepID=UPI0025D65501|nr:Ig-like domain-containing protein [Sulfurovum sp.]
MTGKSFDLPQGDKEWITAYGHYSDGSKEDINRYVSYSSSDRNVAYVIDEIDSNVHGRNPSTATINVDWQGVHAEVAVNVTASTIEIQEGCSSSQTDIIDDSNPLELTIDEEQCINAWLVHKDGTKERVTTTVFWKSQDQSIASMDLLQRNSKVTGVAAGSTTVSATLDGVTGKAPVVVSEP